LESAEEQPVEKHTGDRIVAIVLLVVTGVVAAGLAFAGLMLIMSIDACGSDGGPGCNTGLFTIAWLMSMAFPVAGFVATAIYTFVKIHRHERAVVVPLMGLLIYGAGFALSIVVAFQALN
jgi:hypothetical protein